MAHLTGAKRGALNSQNAAFATQSPAQHLHPKLAHDAEDAIAADLIGETVTFQIQI